MDHDSEFIFPYAGNIWKLDFHKLLVPWKYWKLDFPIFQYPGNIGNMFFYILGFLQKRRAPNFHAGCTDG